MDLVKEILRGVMIGVANIIPGVSGGTMAVSMGIYDKMIYAVNHLRTERKKSVLTLFPYLVGMILGIAVLSFVISFLFEEYPFQTSMGFIGLILGGVPAIWKRISTKEGNRPYVILAIFFIGIILLQIFGGGKETILVLTPGVGEAVKLFFVGVLASATMVVPGVSGSMILMLLGVYTPILEQIQLFIKGTLALDLPVLLSSMALLIPFGIGVLIGIVLIAKLIGFLLEHFETHTYMGILGLVFASPVVVFLQMEAIMPGILGIVVGVLCLILGLFVANAMADK